MTWVFFTFMFLLSAGCTVKNIESQPLGSIEATLAQGYVHETGEPVPEQLPLQDRMTALLDSALDRAYDSPCENDVVFYASYEHGWTLSCTDCRDYSGSPWFRSGEAVNRFAPILHKHMRRGFRQDRYVTYPDLMEKIGVCPLPPVDSAARYCLERAGWIAPAKDRKWQGGSWVVCASDDDAAGDSSSSGP